MIIKISNQELKDPVNSSLTRCAWFFERLIWASKHEEINFWVAGGAIRSYFQRDEKIQDVDLFTTTRIEAAKLTLSLRRLGFKAIFINRNAIKGYIQFGKNRVYVDIVKRFYDTEIKCLEDFDFSVCKFAYNFKSKDFFYSQMAFADLATKKLVIPDPNFSNSLGSLKRMQKYIQKGYKACNGTILTIAKKVAAIDFNDPLQNDIEFYPDGSPMILLFD